MICLNSVNIRSKICKRFLDSDKVSLRLENWAKIFSRYFTQKCYQVLSEYRAVHMQSAMKNICSYIFLL